MSPKFEKVIVKVTQMLGSQTALFGACVIIGIWAICGPIYHFSRNWQIAINTFTLIITFLMVFLAQNDSNRNFQALHIKLDQLLETDFETVEPSSAIEEKIEQLNELATVAKLINTPEETMSTDEIEIKSVLLEKIKQDSNPTLPIQGPEPTSQVENDTKAHPNDSESQCHTIQDRTQVWDRLEHLDQPKSQDHTASTDEPRSSQSLHVHRQEG